MAKTINQYQYKDVTYTPIGRKWKFTSPTFEFIHGCRGGHEVAAKVAVQLYAALARTKGTRIDGLGRHQIRAIAPIN